MVSFGAGGGCSVVASITVTLTGTPAFSQGFLSCNIGGVCNVGAPIATYSGAATGARYVLDMLSMVYSQGLISSTYFPGSIAGTIVGHGAVYN
jgi:hypothetical protein